MTGLVVGFIFDGFLLTLKLESLGDREVEYKLELLIYKTEVIILMQKNLRQKLLKPTVKNLYCVYFQLYSGYTQKELNFVTSTERQSDCEGVQIRQIEFMIHVKTNFLFHKT